ncbi:hypothetical protein BG004_005651 [Podila humilis]|nr:hypothetical protein BG004_005651 [Podila humilis]
MQEKLMFTRRQKTLSNISNFLPLHIVLNQPAGVKFSITVSKYFTVEQLARQIEAEYAYLVEREIGHSRFPVIQCGALFDHLETGIRKNKKKHLSRQRVSLCDSVGDKNNKTGHCSTQRSQSQPPPTNRSLSATAIDNDTIMPPMNVNSIRENQRKDNFGSSDSSAVDSDTEHEEEEEEQEQDSRGVQLRFSDIVGDVLDRDSIVHVVNIDQGMCGMKNAWRTVDVRGPYNL